MLTEIILGACRTPVAYDAIQAEPSIATDAKQRINAVFAALKEN